MAKGCELEILLLQSPGERPLRGTVRNFLMGSGVTVLISCWNFLWGDFQLINVAGYLLVGNALSFFGWGAERLWYSTISPMLGNPFSWYAYLTRIPFWYFAGGTGYVVSMLLAKKLGLLMLNDIPVKQLFDTGGLIECGIQVPLQIFLYQSLLKRYREVATNAS